MNTAEKKEKIISGIIAAINLGHCVTGIINYALCIHKYGDVYIVERREELFDDEGYFADFGDVTEFKTTRSQEDLIQYLLEDCEDDEDEDWVDDQMGWWNNL